MIYMISKDAQEIYFDKTGIHADLCERSIEIQLDQFLVDKNIVLLPTPSQIALRWWEYVT